MKIYPNLLNPLNFKSCEVDLQNPKASLPLDFEIDNRTVVLPGKFYNTLATWNPMTRRGMFPWNFKTILYKKTSMTIKWQLQGLPWWRSGWESACQCRGHRFEPWSGKIPHAAEQLGPWATITEPARLESVLRNKRGRVNERPAHRDEEWPPLYATGESPRTETKTQHSHK